MAIVVTLWGVRLTWNYNRRGGYTWPILDGEEDYRWKVLQASADILRNKVVVSNVECFRRRSIRVFLFLFSCGHPKWFAFNLLFISCYQNVLLFLIVAPSLVAHIVVTRCLTGYDYFATALILLLIVVEAVVDSEQYIFHTEKYRRKNAGDPLTGEYADGFKSSGQ